MRLTTESLVLEVPACPGSRRLHSWLADQRLLRPVRVVEQPSPRSARCLTDCGSVYLGPDAWIMLLWAIEPHRERAQRWGLRTDRAEVAKEIGAFIASEIAASPAAGLLATLVVCKSTINE